MNAALDTEAEPAGYPDLIDRLHERCRPGGLVASPTGHTLASPHRLHAPGPPDASAFGDLSQGSAVSPAPALDQGAGLAVRTAAPTTGPAAEAFAEGLLDLHATVLAKAVDHAVAHLRDRTSEGASLLSRPQLQSDLADAALAVHEYRAGYLPGSGAAARWDCHLRLTDAGRTVLRLLGGSAMLTDGPAPALHAAELAGNVYLHPGLEADDAD